MRSTSAACRNSRRLGCGWAAKALSSAARPATSSRFHPPTPGFAAAVGAASVAVTKGRSGLRQRWRRRGAVGNRQHLVAVVGDQHGMFPLRGEAVVGGHDGPAIGETANARAAGVDHRLDRENHPRLQLETRPRPAVMQDLRLLVKLATDAVTAE